MECCDSVSNNGASGPHTQQPPGLCRPLAPSPLLMARDQAIHRSTVNLSKQGGLVGQAEEERLAGRHEERVREKQVNECSTREMLKEAAEKAVEKADEEEECDDLERPIGEILYQPDGSVYVMESRLTSGKPSSSLGDPSSIRACYISSSEKPTPQIFHVFQLHNLDDGESLALVTRQSKDSAPDVAGSSETEVTWSGLTKHILMCFLCRLSFGRTHSFRAHASQQHNITFSDEEQHLLSFKHTSAILKPAGPGNRPLLCFLKQKRNCESEVPFNLESLTSGNSTEETARLKENEEALTSKPGLPLLPSSPRTSPATSVPSPAKDPSTLGREGTQRGKEDEIRKNGGSSEVRERRLCLEVGSTVDNGAQSISSSSGQEHITEAALSNQSISKPTNSVTTATSFMNNTKTLTDSESECGTSFNCHDPAPAFLVVVNPSTVSSTEQLAHQESATATEPNDHLDKSSAIAMESATRLSEDNKHVTHCDLPNNHSHSTSPTLSPTLTQTGQPTLEEGHQDTASRGRLVMAGDGGFVAAGDDVQGSSFNSGIQATLVHTRNSCKTLKCPKCNWHYKYQQTLEAHMKEKHPESESEQCPYCSSGQSHPRLARGETYSCGYKPFRCQVCQYSTTTKGNLSIHMQSDKHLNNMQSLQMQSHTHSPASQPNPLTHSHSTLTQPTQANSPSPSKLRGHASWRCEVCDYETNVARNLRIHMTSEKHTHNVLLLQQNLAHMQHQRKHNTTELYRVCQPQTKLLCNEISSQKLFECILCGCFSCDTLEELSQHLTMQRSLPNSYWRSTTGDTHHCRLCHYATPLRANFQLHCQTDKHLQRYQLAAHLREANGQHGNSEEEEEEEEWRLRCVAAGSQVQLRCNACDYEASSLEKLKLHTMNSRHESSLRLYKYLQQLDGEESEDVWLHCVLCDFSTQNSLSLVQHSHSLSHQRGEGLLRLQRIKKGLQDGEELGAIFTIRKSSAQENGDQNEMDSPTEAKLNQENRNMNGDRTEKKSEGFIQMEVEQNESSCSPQHPSSGSDESAEPSPCKWPRIQEEMRQCPFCQFHHTDIERLRSHVMNQHAVQPVVRCPLCQDTLHSIALLRTHLTHLHSVTADCTQKLINTVIASDVLPEKMFLPMHKPINVNETKRLDENTANAEPEIGTTPHLEASKIYKQPSEDAESTKENNAAFPCWQKGCNKVFTSSSALQTHFNQLHGQKSPTAMSDHHIYKYRCNQCSLAFKTPEKLQMHSRYHTIRAATMCCLCQRSFRTMQALRKHLETSHLDLSETQIQQLYGVLMMKGETLICVDQTFDEEEGLPEEHGMKDDEECDLEEKLSPTENDSSLVKDNVECDPKQPVFPLRKGPNITLEKFLDPSRPFKCTVCKESFTQKNILLVHYNSVSHLHKLKRSLQDTSTGLQEPVNNADQKPFKCSICHVAYSQSSTLEIHMRSVLHQTKARASKLDSSASSSESVGPTPGKALSNTPATMNNACLSHQKNNQLKGIPANPDTSHPSTSELRNKLINMLDSATKQQQIQSLQQQQLAQAQVHLQQELQKKAALIQSHLFNPALLHPFPMATEALLPVQQQQQLLLPFLIPGGEFRMNPEVNLKGSGLNATKIKPNVNEDIAESSKKDVPKYGSKRKQDEDKMDEQKLNDLPFEKDVDGQNSNEESKEFENVGTGEKTQCSKTQENEDLHKEMSTNGEGFGEFLPPRIAHDASGNASKALLENIGFELVMQYNEDKQRYQKNLTEPIPNGRDLSDTEDVGHSEDMEKLECESCGKLFSNALILKSHKEQIHHSIFPIKSLEKFAKDYREQYDKIFPLRLATSDASPVSSPSPTPLVIPNSSVQQPQPQQPVQPIIPASTLSTTPATVSIPQVKSPLAQIPLPMELPLFPPLLMPPIPLQGLTPQVPVHLPPVEAGLTPDLLQFYQQQLNPAMFQQSKRPRTRITDDQLRILRLYFDINNSPNEDQIHEMANKSDLPHKVIKHWFRNTLFKERQRNKDSPYNFSNPPVTTLEDVKVDSRPPSPEPPRQEIYGSKRSSRTRFTDYQLRVLQDFFDANAYPKDDEFEQLSNLLNLSTRVIVVWFQNARQKARKNYENQGEGEKDSERRDLSNDRYFRTSNNNFQCKKCNVVFQCIFDLINHQKEQCYKDDEEEMQNDLNETEVDFKTECHSPVSGPSCFTQAASCSSPSSSVSSTNVKFTDSEHMDTCLTEELKQTNEASSDPKQTVSISSELEELEKRMQQPKPHCEENQNVSKEIPSHPPPKQQQISCTSETSPAPSKSSQTIISNLDTPSTEQKQQKKPAQDMSPYHCIQCKLSFPSFEHWQEHQQMHFLAQSYFPTPQFLDHPVDMPLMLFDPANPLLARHLLSGTISQIVANQPTVTTIPDSTINSLKRKLEEKAGSSSFENDWENNGEEPQRDKRMRTTITPEQLEVLYQKYLLDSNPTRKMLDHISNEVGLKKRVVQVWFQNTRARERKGQFRALGPSQIHRRCPFCRALFKAQTALAAHIRSRHWHEAKNAGCSMAIPNMTQDQEGSQIKSELFDFANYSQFLNSTDDSPVCKSMDRSSHQLRLSPKPFIGDGMEDFEMPSMSVYQNFEQSKLNNCDTNTSHDHTTGEGHDSLEATHGSIDHMSPSTDREASSESDEKMSSGLVSPSISFNAKDFDNDLVLDYSENSSLADPASPSPGSSNSQSCDSDRHSQKRNRTQMTNLQVKVLKACFSDYKTPTMLECKALGNDIGLAKRVVQVWFQNARAKEKKAKLSLAKQFGTESTSIDRPKTECTLCSVKYSSCLSIRDHVFSQQHLTKVKEALGGQMERDKEYLGSISTHQLMAQQEAKDHLKNTSYSLGIVQPQNMLSSVGLNQTALHCLSQSSMYSSLQTQTTASMPGGSSTMTEDFPSIKTEGSRDRPVHDLTCKPTTTPSSAISAMDDKDVVSTTNSVLTPKTTEQEFQFPKENDTESSRIPTNKLDSTPLGNSNRANSSRKNKEKSDSSRPTVSTPNNGRECGMDPTQLQALHAAMKTNHTALLPSPLLPCLMPGFPPLFSPHIPTPMPGGLLQPMFGMDSMFPYGPALPQALMGLSPGSILQQYQQNLQGALMQQRLQLQQTHLVQLPEKPKPSQISARLNADDTVSSKHDKKQGPTNSTDSPFINAVNTKQPEVDNNFLLSHCIVSKTECRTEGNDGHLYDCLACEVSLHGNAELIKHLEYPQHIQRVTERLNAKEHASPQLPHISPSSTSQSNPSSEQRSSTTAQSSLGTPSATSIPNPTNSDQPNRHLQSSPASPSHHVLSPSNVTSSLTSPAKTCHVKPIDLVLHLDGRCDSNESEEGQDSL
ncbi:zinc finger homeobox protein 3 [Carassius gibelio]|uniref:zinc finger homeobox protein 3 n=1 Tax=Carassius gibelio TaxID=101364 RepID=UPI002277D4AC|nr:zinc finger homeobox protein 3 [Carassius gibelio]